MFPNAVQDTRWSARQQSLIPLEQYHLQPQLDAQEQEALAGAAAYFAGQRRTALPPDLQSQLVGLLQPLTDITTRLGIPSKHCKVYMPVMLLEMQRCSTTYWGWSEEQWAKLIVTSVPQFSQDSNQDLRRLLLLFAYLVGPQTDFFLPLLEGMLPFSLASTLFGKNVMNAAVERVLEALKTWGFEVATDNTRKCLKTTLAEVLLVNQSTSLAACRRERSRGQASRSVSVCVLPGTGGSDSMEHGRRQKTVGDRERAGCKHVVAPALHSG